MICVYMYITHIHIYIYIHTYTACDCTAFVATLARAADAVCTRHALTSACVCALCTHTGVHTREVEIEGSKLLLDRTNTKPAEPMFGSPR